MLRTLRILLLTLALGAIGAAPAASQWADCYICDYGSPIPCNPIAIVGAQNCVQPDYPLECYLFGDVVECWSPFAILVPTTVSTLSHVEFASIGSASGSFEAGVAITHSICGIAVHRNMGSDMRERLLRESEVISLRRS